LLKKDFFGRRAAGTTMKSAQSSIWRPSVYLV